MLEPPDGKSGETLSARRVWCAQMAGGLLAMAAAGPLRSQAISETPTSDELHGRTLRLLVPFAVGGSADLVARWLGARLKGRLSQTVIVDNRPGAGGNLALEAAGRAAPDGTTWLLGTAVYATSPIFQRTPLDPQRDLAPVMLVAMSDMLLFARRDLPASRLDEVVALIQARPGAITCASTGGGSRLGCEVLAQYARAGLTIAEYKGSAPALNDLVGGHVDLLFDLAVSGRPLAASGRIKPIARTAPTEDRTVPDVLPGFDYRSWVALFAPAATPAALIARMNAELQQILDAPETRLRFQELGLMVHGGPPADLAARLRDDTERYRSIARAAGFAIP